MSRADPEASFLHPNQAHLTQDPTVPPAQTLSNRDVVRVDNGLSVATAQRLQEFIDETLDYSLEVVNSFRVPRGFRFAYVLEKGNRYNMLLPFDDDKERQRQRDEQEAASISSPPPDSSVMLDAMNELLREAGTIGPILEELLGENAILYELACLISDPGSNRQAIHPDIVFQPDRIPLVACFVSLQDVDSSMGPTVFLPDTVLEDYHRKINNDAEADEMLKSIPSVISTLNMGDRSLYNPMVLHAGGGNESN
eukprot:CAMPEP_0172480700 /NCGR_PEP_ID=MMETSP1066-20121228/6050_1 /TAXON_ID=671091 /ORGANISM="Coscinodiscus wailesii, Strain CCMP2513" /LENGTH=252 /DNA_ID=CAMNT_0013242263 /DNA_START=688 /DNA_END=1446 /DNA_ORIENTATION=-